MFVSRCAETLDRIGMTDKIKMVVMTDDKIRRAESMVDNMEFILWADYAENDEAWYDEESVYTEMHDVFECYAEIIGIQDELYEELLLSVIADMHDELFG